LDQIWKGNYEFVEREFSFLNGSELMKELGNRYVIENLCKVHGFERKKTFESFLRRWNLWFMFDEGIPTEHRILHHKDWIEDYRRVSMKPFGWKPSECELSKEGCSRKGKFYSLRYLSCRAWCESTAIKTLLKEAADAGDYEFVTYVLDEYNLWSSTPHVRAVVKRTPDPERREFFLSKGCFYEDDREILLGAWKVHSFKRGDFSTRYVDWRSCLRAQVPPPSHTRIPSNLDIKGCYLSLGMLKQAQQSDECLKRDAVIYRLGDPVPSKDYSCYALASGRWDVFFEYRYHKLEGRLREPHLPCLKLSYLTFGVIPERSIVIDMYLRDYNEVPARLVEMCRLEHPHEELHVFWKRFGATPGLVRLLKQIHDSFENRSPEADGEIRFYINWMEMMLN
jgi:hypothetical protein